MSVSPAPQSSTSLPTRWLAVSLLISLLVSGATGWLTATLVSELASSGAPGTIAALLGMSVGFFGTWLVSLITLLRRRRQQAALARLSEELREIARGERDALSSGMPRRDSLWGPLVDLASSIRNQRAILNQQQRSLNQILEGMGEGLLAIDREKRIILANERLRTLFGIPRPRVGQPYYEVIRNATVIDAFDQGLGGRAGNFHALVSVAGEERQIEIRVFPTAESSEIAVVALFIDITRLERLARVRRDFVADFSHEVRTPLAGIRTSIETFDKDISEEQRAHLLRILDRQLARLERLVSDLSELNSIESGETILHREPTEIRQLLADLAEDFLERAESRRVSIRIEGDEASVFVDPVRIEQVFTNLIDNAIRHAPQSDEIRIEVIDGETTTEVRVTDLGPGIPKGEAERIFHRFYRIDKSRSSEMEGTGLGLAITKHLVIQHGGTIRVESEIGKGATFVVTLPKRRQDVPSRESSRHFEES